MKNNRRNYYRILHVQPEAPAEIIKASYRTLMSTLKMHPDLGGDHETAALINEAYAVLGDRARRTVYDRQLGVAKLRGRADAPRAATSARQARAYESAQPAPAQAGEPIDGCPWCRAALPPKIEPETRCTKCRSPLAAPPAPGNSGREMFGRRASARNARTQLAIMHQMGQGPGLSVRVRDLSLTGIGLQATATVAEGTRIRIQAPDFEAIAIVISSRRARETYTVHARLLTLAGSRRSGVFVSETA